MFLFFFSYFYGFFRGQTEFVSVYVLPQSHRLTAVNSNQEEPDSELCVFIVKLSEFPMVNNLDSRSPNHPVRF